MAAIIAVRVHNVFIWVYSDKSQYPLGTGTLIFAGIGSVVPKSESAPPISYKRQLSIRHVVTFTSLLALLNSRPSQVVDNTHSNGIVSIHLSKLPTHSENSQKTSTEAGTTEVRAFA